MNTARRSTRVLAWALGIALACAGAAGCQFATGLSGFDTRDDGSGGAGASDASASTSKSGSGSSGIGTQDTSATSTTGASTVTAASGTGSGSASTGVQVDVLANGLERPTEIVLHQGVLYFIEEGEPGVPFTGAIWRAAADGTTPPEALVTGLTTPRRLAVAGTTLFFVDADPDVVKKIELAVMPLSATPFVDGPFGQVTHLAVDQSHVYWSAAGTLYRAAFGIDPPTEIVLPAAGQGVSVFDVDDQSSSPLGYGVRGSDVLSFPKTPAATSTVIGGRGNSIGWFARGPNHLYWTDAIALRAYRFSDDVTSTIFDTDGQVVERIAASPTDPARVFWTNRKALRTYAPGAGSVDVSAGHQHLLGLALDATHAYVVDNVSHHMLRVTLPDL